MSYIVEWHWKSSCGTHQHRAESFVSRDAAHRFYTRVKNNENEMAPNLIRAYLKEVTVLDEAP